MIRRADGMTVYGGPHVGTRGSLSSIRHNGPEDFSEGIPEADAQWEQAVRAAMITKDASFGARWHGDWESWDEPDDLETGITAGLWGSTYRRQEPMEPPFGRR
jgi:hypothetical protein